MAIPEINIQRLLQAALVHHQSGRLQQAEEIYRNILSQIPEHADANNLLGVLAYQVGKFDLAVSLIRNALKQDPGQYVFYNNLGNALKAKGDLQEAVEAYGQALALKPDYGEALFNLGNGLMAQGRPADAVSAYKKALGVMPGSAEVNYNLGNALKELDRFHEAVEAYKQALTIRHEYAEAHYNLGSLFLKLRQPDEAAASCRRALAINPGYAEAHNNLGKALAELDCLDQAAESFQAALALKPDYVEARCNLGSTFLKLDQINAAMEHYRKALAIKPDFDTARSGLAAAHSALLSAMLYLPGASQEDIFKEARKWDQQHAQPLRVKQKPHTNSREKNRRLRIGYVSPDFRGHAVNIFFEPLLKAHDRERFEIFLYANVSKPDDVTRRLQTEADHWLSIVKMSDTDAAERIREDGIDILVDLAKHSADNRLLLFAHKPAPVQATWLGYPCSTGMDAMDYRMVDGMTHPIGRTDHLNSEELIRLPHGYFCFEPKINVPVAETSPAGRNRGVTFGSFNNILKIQQDIIVIWSAILNRVPGSRLIMLGKGFAEESTREKFTGLFAGQGIEAARVEMIPFLPYIEYLAMYGKVDIALDSFPYNGHTTTCDSLLMGLPVITLTGAPDCSRVGASILSRVGLPELIAENRREYIDKAVKLAQDTGRLSVLRKGMRARVLNSSLCDVRTFTKSMESAYEKMWDRFLAETTEG